MKLATLSLSLLLALFGPLSLHAESPVDKAIAKASEQNLAASPQWKALLHYTTSWLGSESSLIKNPDFFLSEDGGLNPSAELEATLRAFSLVKSENLREQHPQCTYAGRFLFLSKTLELTKLGFPVVPCPLYASWRGALNPSKATLIFSSAFLNNPASMFGHTFLRIDPPSRNGVNPLLAYAANYSAAIGSDPGIIFAVKGVFGGYNGYFSVDPYYEKVKKYNDFENRDLWEYPLNLTPEELGLLIAHLWELQSIGSPYFYFDENCSYHLLSILDVARPSLKLLSQFRGWVIPTDTLKGVLANPTLSSPPFFRASPVSKLRYFLTLLTKEEIEKGIKLAEGKGADEIPLESPKEAHALELASHFLEYKRVQRKETRSDSAPRFIDLLKKRSALTAPRLPEEPPMPATAPESGHGSSTLYAGGGWKGHSFVEFGIRPAYHSLIDAEDGYTKGAEIEILRTSVRLYRDENLTLSSLNLLSITSLAPRNELLKPLSWSGEATVQRTKTHYDDDALVTSVNAALGITSELAPALQWYALGGPKIEYSTDLEGNFTGGPEGRFGLLFDLSEKIRVKPQLRASRLFGERSYSRIISSVEARYTLSQNLALLTLFSLNDEFNRTTKEGSLRLAWYF